jgi:hypothetical protein
MRDPHIRTEVNEQSRMNDEYDDVRNEFIGELYEEFSKEGYRQHPCKNLL